MVVFLGSFDDMFRLIEVSLLLVDYLIFDSIDERLSDILIVHDLNIESKLDADRDQNISVYGNRQIVLTYIM